MVLMEALQHAFASVPHVNIRLFHKGEMQYIPSLKTLERLRSLIAQQTENRTLLLTSVFDDWVRSGTLVSAAFVRLKLLTLAYEIAPEEARAIIHQQHHGSWWGIQDDWALIEAKLKSLIFKNIFNADR
jgi:hypothetical protein